MRRPRLAWTNKAQANQSLVGAVRLAVVPLPFPGGWVSAVQGLPEIRAVHVWLVLYAQANRN